ncbi:aminoglycoside phosphotransferase family protein [Arthrobacter cupressi]|uniref:Predicted kinase, aminoglycoside phosphotransferase (APT) family n=1 Tax=Arthrobacter cupressi TaxID=1045773 RepID=A0A1G8WBU6_9MICC|nr:aminoglycoside phosphotransferase family protein [Arthrobacter cupressi]NYD76350.1 aminoglycoside phosphotransferase (APT) family kinase protein [Arthrobacter cupressi]SDJ75040.1 Predicted kinase, aminoglycoside phosphotransferase (APT) family [Arthrobacter cupressi]
MALMPAADVDITEDLVRRLLAAQAPALAAEPLELAANGWDNAVYRLGSTRAVRLPRREAAAELVLREQRWLPGYARRSPVPVPAPVYAGRPDAGYPWHWSVIPWLEGTSATQVSPEKRTPAAEQLAAFLTAIHVPAPAAAPVNPVRGVPLASRSAAVLERLEDTHGYPEAARLRSLWAAALEAPPHSGPAVWFHGDLHPANVLLRDSPDGPAALAAVIDFGDLGAGDPAVDLAVAWLMFDGAGRRRLMAAYSAAGSGQRGGWERGGWERARGWALVLATAMLSNSDDNPVMLETGRFAVRQLLRP